MEILEGTINPDKDTNFEAEIVSDDRGRRVSDVGPVGEVAIRMVGTVSGKEFSGTLTVFIQDGEFDGWHWAGTELTADEETILLDVCQD